VRSIIEVGFQKSDSHEIVLEIKMPTLVARSLALEVRTCPLVQAASLITDLKLRVTLADPHGMKNARHEFDASLQCILQKVIADCALHGYEVKYPKGLPTF
jgi:hypothetical protein